LFFLHACRQIALIGSLQAWRLEPAAAIVINSLDACGADAGVVDRIMAAMSALEANRANPVTVSEAFKKRFPTCG